MNKKKVHLTSLDAFVEQTVVVDAEGRDEAVEKAIHGEGSLISERVYGIEADVYSAEVTSGDSAKPTWEVVGVFLDTDDLQPFRYMVGAEGPREALLRALGRKAWGRGSDRAKEFVSEHIGADLRPLATEHGIRPASIRQAGLTGRSAEKLPEIEGYG